MFFFSLLLIIIAIIIIFAVLIRIFIIDNIRIADISGKAILVTGSAGGFGRKFVEKCLQNDITVFAGCRTKESADRLLDELKEFKGYLFAFQMDIASEESVEHARLFITKQLEIINKDLYAIVNNAGIQAQCIGDDFVELNAYEEAVNVNTYGPIRVTKAFKDLIKKSKGRIVFCTSCICRFPSPGFAPYAVSKWALSGYVEVLRHEVGYYGVNVINIEPGIFVTPLNDVQKMMNSMNKMWKEASKNVRDEYGEYWFSKAKRMFIDIRDASTSDVTPVCNAYYHAITAIYPYRNYVVGYDAKFVFQPFSWLPSRLQELSMQLLAWCFGAPKPAIVD